ncbi:MAG: 16S rRNA (guanine(527)-N(7))-methyltransferase RsmG [Bacteroidota bacterium]|nr:16S rRNA (guanine(527)-N(7))-methyltransferase RsmG [Bacteroidota bacterium]
MTTIAEKYFPHLSPLQRRQFSLLPSLYSRWNEKINVVSRKDIENFEVNHLLHSLAIAKFISFVPGTTVIDVGTGGGLPGIPLAIFFPEVKFTLVDSIAKKIKVAAAIASEAGIENITAVTARAETLKGKYDFVIGRAVTETEQFVRLTRHLVSRHSSNERKNGWILLKGGDLDDELTPFRGNAEVTAVSNWFEEPWFETKKLVYMPF